LAFLPPDRLAREGAEARLVLVDEAAAIPAPLLARLLQRHARLAFATTVHGYEGTGRGFDLRFGPLLEARSRGVHRVRLETPVRWAPGDPVEGLVFRALLLDAEPAPAEAAAAAAARARPAREDREALADDEPRLAQVFGLLVQAHYRTRPFDLRCLLDGPNLAVWTAAAGGTVVATALVADEGGFDEAAARRIWAGLRRPHGHLVPESLAVHLGLEAGARLRCARIMRIAVHPAARRRGLGLRLVEAVAADAAARGLELAGTAFGAAPELVAFWRRAGFVPVRVGVRRGTASGAHAVLMLRPLAPAGETLAREARAAFVRRLPAQLADPLRGLEPALAAALLAGGPADWERVAAAGWGQPAAFAFGHRGYEECLDALRPLAAAALADPGLAGVLDAGARTLLVAKVLQGRPWAEAAAAAGLPGRAAAQAALRAALRPVLLARGGEAVRRTLARLRAAGVPFPDDRHAGDADASEPGEPLR
ncbi:MAG TPA: tRNA(Met) cytidine acetyltransferase, partial [Chromatiales bacterium]|nr:tRNA(Met) cytidine acetyltransferase [Chromatiales bacterium]